MKKVAFRFAKKWNVFEAGKGSRSYIRDYWSQIQL